MASVFTYILIPLLTPLLVVGAIMIFLPVFLLGAPIGVLLLNVFSQCVRSMSRLSRLMRLGIRGIVTWLLESSKLPFSPVQYSLSQTPDDTTVCSCIRASHKIKSVAVVSSARWHGNDYHQKAIIQKSLLNAKTTTQSAGSFDQWMNSDLLPENEWASGVYPQCYICPIRSKVLRKELLESFRH